jgi:ADP-ribosylglycohydrolase
MKLPAITAKYGPDGITELAVDPRTGTAEVTDDTQMTLFTAEGMLRGICRAHRRGVGGPESTLPPAYRRWLLTQEGWEHFAPRNTSELEFLLGETLAAHGPLSGAVRSDTLAHCSGDVSGWLIREPALHVRRAPGTTCRSALRSYIYGTGRPAENDSKGCGGVMRVAPIGLVRGASLGTVFELACVAAGITHGHPTGILASGVFAAMIRGITDGATIEESLAVARVLLERQPDHQETSAAIAKSVRAAKSRKQASPAMIAWLGAGWVADEALAIAIYCALRGEASEDVAWALRLAVNHDGDSDSTGSLTGQLLGARFGVEGLPARWVARVELRDIITTVADDLVTEHEDGDRWWGRYPGF